MHTFPQRRRAGFTLIELLVVIAIIAVLAAILFPVFTRAREKARQQTCVSNQKQLAAAIMMYVQDHAETLPGLDWRTACLTGDTAQLSCPNLKGQFGYGLNGYLIELTLGEITDPSHVIATMDAIVPVTVDADMTRHVKGAIFSHVDGSVSYADIYTLEKSGRFSTGTFPVQPITTDANNQPFIQAPANFTAFVGGIPNNPNLPEFVCKEFMIAGPYGDNSIATGQTVTQATQAKLDTDYCGEMGLANAAVDNAPYPGNGVPSADKILPPIAGTDDLTTPGNPFDVWVDKTQSIKSYKFWTPVDNKGGASPTDQGTYALRLPAIYNDLYYGRSTYAVAYIYSEIEQDVKFDWWCDDVGYVWLNGVKIANDALITGVSDLVPDAPNKPDQPNPQALMHFPKGISYLVVKCTNATDSDPAAPTNMGGMKFRLRFFKPVAGQLPENPPGTFNPAYRGMLDAPLYIGSVLQ